MAITDEFAADLGSIEGDFAGHTITWNGTDYPCFASGVTRGGAGAGIAWNATDDLRIVIRAELFEAARPAKEQTLTYNGTAYRIDRILTAPGGAFLRIFCVFASRGA